MNTLHPRIPLLSLLLLSFSLTSEAKVVTSTEAATVASSFLRSSTGMQKTLQLCEHHNRRHAPSQQSTAAPAYHLFTGTDGKGFVIVSGDDVALPILGYSPDAPVTADGTLPPAMQDLLDDLEGEIRQAQANGLETTHSQWSTLNGQSSMVNGQWPTAASTGIPVVQLTTARWGQSAPFNLQCPKDNGTFCLSGCVPTAYAILMKYYGYPTQGRGVTDSYTTGTRSLSVPSRDLNHAYDWDNMPLDYSSYNSTQAANVAQLMADLGASFMVDYTNNNTVTGFYQPSLFAHFGFNPGNYEHRYDYSDSDWMTKLQAELDQERPVVYRGASADGEIGHAFILDGYKR